MTTLWWRLQRLQPWWQLRSDDGPGRPLELPRHKINPLFYHCTHIIIRTFVLQANSQEITINMRYIYYIWILGLLLLLILLLLLLLLNPVSWQLVSNMLQNKCKNIRVLLNLDDIWLNHYLCLMLVIQSVTNVSTNYKGRIFYSWILLLMLYLLVSLVFFFFFSLLCASAMLKHVIDIGWMSVCLSVTRWYCIKTAEHIVMLSSPHDSPFVLVLCVSRSSLNSDGVTPCGGAKYRWGIKICIIFYQ